MTPGTAPCRNGGTQVALAAAGTAQRAAPRPSSAMDSSDSRPSSASHSASGRSIGTSAHANDLLITDADLDDEDSASEQELGSLPDLDMPQSTISTPRGGNTRSTCSSPRGSVSSKAHSISSVALIDHSFSRHVDSPVSSSPSSPTGSRRGSAFPTRIGSVRSSFKAFEDPDQAFSAGAHSPVNMRRLANLPYLPPEAGDSEIATAKATASANAAAAAAAAEAASKRAANNAFKTGHRHSSGPSSLSSSSFSSRRVVPVISEAEEAKESASDTARRIALAAVGETGSKTRRSQRTGGEQPRLAGGGSVEHFEPSLVSLPEGDPITAAPSEAELAKRRAEQAAREIALAATPDRARPPRTIEQSSSDAASEQQQQQQQQQAVGGGAPSAAPSASSFATEAEAAKHRASQLAKEVAERAEREAAERRRAFMRAREPPTTQPQPPPPQQQQQRQQQQPPEAERQHGKLLQQQQQTKSFSVRQRQQQQQQTTTTTTTSSAREKSSVVSLLTRSSSGVGSSGAIAAASSGGEPKQRSARAALGGQKAWLMTLLKPEHRGGQLSRGSSRESKQASTNVGSTFRARVGPAMSMGQGGPPDAQAQAQ